MHAEAYNGGLLPLARGLGERLLPALMTDSGIPFGSVNLRYGVAHNESPVACTAAAGTLVLEFGMLSRLTGDARFEQAAKRAALGVWNYRSEIDLLGAHGKLVCTTNHAFLLSVSYNRKAAFVRASCAGSEHTHWNVDAS